MRFPSIADAIISRAHLFYFVVFFYFRRGVFFSFYERWANGVASPLIEIDFLIPLFFCFVVVVVVVVVAVVVWLFFATAIGRSLTSFSMNKNRAITSIELEFSLQHGVFFLIKEKQNIEINRISKKKLFWAFTVFFLFCFNQVWSIRNEFPFGLYLDLPRLIGFDRIMVGSTGFYRVLPGFYRVLPSFSWFLLGCAGF